MAGTLAVWLDARVDTTYSLLTYKPLRNGCRSYCCVPSSSDSRGVSLKWHFWVVLHTFPMSYNTNASSEGLEGLSGLTPSKFSYVAIVRKHQLQSVWRKGFSQGCLGSPRVAGLLAFHSEQFKSQSEEDALSFRIWPLSPTWLRLLDFIFKSISKFFIHSRDIKLDSRRLPQQTLKPPQKVNG